MRAARTARLQVFFFPDAATRSRRFFGYWLLACGLWEALPKPETRDQRPETRDQRPETYAPPSPPRQALLIQPSNDEVSGWAGVERGFLGIAPRVPGYPALAIGVDAHDASADAAGVL